MENELVGKYTMPGIGFGTLGNVGDAGSALVEAALAEGYRYIDTSRFYGNEEAVGRALARSSVPRGDIWVTTKLLHPKTPPQPDLNFATVLPTAYPMGFEGSPLKIMGPGDTYRVYGISASTRAPVADGYVVAKRDLTEGEAVDVFIM